MNESSQSERLKLEKRVQIEASAFLESTSLFGTALCLSSWLCLLEILSTSMACSVNVLYFPFWQLALLPLYESGT